MQKQYQYILLFKPYGVLSQFTDPGGRRTLADFGPFPHTVYPVGRLDADSEGLLLLTNDKEVTTRLTDPQYNHPRTYLVQVEGTITAHAIEQLCRGVFIQGSKTKPAEAEIVGDDPPLALRPIPIRYRKNIPTSWIRITLYEGRNRQVRKMTAAVGFPTLRLVRVGIGGITDRRLQPGTWRNLTVEEIRKLKA